MFYIYKINVVPLKVFLRSTAFKKLMLDKISQNVDLKFLFSLDLYVCIISLISDLKLCKNDNQNLRSS